MEGSCLDQNEGTSPAFISKNRGILRKISLRISETRVEIQTRVLRNTSSNAKHLAVTFSLFYLEQSGRSVRLISHLFPVPR